MEKEAAGAIRGASNAKACFHPRLLLSSLYGAGFLGLWEVMRVPSSHGLLWNREMTLVLMILGSAAVAATILLATRSRSLDESKIRVLVVLSALLPSLSGLLLFSARFLPEVFLPVEMGAFFLIGLGVPMSFLLWILACGSLSIRSVLLNGGFVLALSPAIVQAIARFAQSDTVYYCVLLLVLGSAAVLFSWNALAESGSGPNRSAATPDRVGDDASFAENVMPQRFLLSIPIAGAMLYALTSGMVFYEGRDMSFAESTVAGLFAALFALLVVALMRRLPNMPASKLMFYVFGLGLPALAFIPFIIKMIPIDFFSDTAYRWFMVLYFEILILATGAYIVSVSRITRVSPVRFCAMTQIAVSASVLVGFAAGSFGYPFDMVFMGCTTACFLIYAVFTVGRNLVLYLKPAEPADKLSAEANGTDLGSVCAKISEEYGLSPREAEVLQELAYGHSSSYVAKVLCVSNNTARTHMKNIYKKLDINSRESLLTLIRGN